LKDRENECTLFAPAVTVAKDAEPNGGGYGGARTVDTSVAQSPRNASDARAAFDSLFKK